MKKHFIITVLASMAFGFAFAIQQTGIKAGLGFTATMTIWCAGFLFYVVAIFTSFEKLKTFIREKEKQDKEAANKETVKTTGEDTITPSV